MNKKRLSVVMAGAMLATSVAPVLAATESEVDSSRLGSLVVKVYDQLTGTLFTKNTELLKDGSLAGQSVYYVKVNGKELTSIKALDLTKDANKAALKDALQEEFKNLAAGDKVEIYSKGFREDANKNIVDATIAYGETIRYTEDDFAHTEVMNNVSGSPVGFKNETVTEIFNALKEGNGILHSETEDYVRVEGNVIKVYLNAGVTVSGASNDGTHDVLTLSKGELKYNFYKYIDANGKVQDITADTTAAMINGFPTIAEDKEDEKVETIKITGKTHNYKTEELYDGLMLTTEGHDLLSVIKENSGRVTFETLNGKTLNSTGSKYDMVVNLTAYKGEYGFVVKITDAFNKTTVYTVKGAEKATETLAAWLKSELARVDILAGSNRYETAVSIAKEQALVVGPTYTEGVDFIDNIVLVNGNSLVDGLSASPLAAKLTAGNGNTNNDYSKIAAPVLLTEADELPKATKAYLRELQANKKIGNKEKATIHFVGGTAVLSRSLEKEIEAMGFKVERYGGANREETSLEVAEALGLNGKTQKFDEVFVVGAEGEADAMSIAGVASREKAPIIVSKKGGLTYDALDALEKEKVTVIGGESAVSKADYEALKEETVAVRRIEGSNRQATNAAVIKEFYHGDYLDDIVGVNKGEVTSVIVAKDGKGNNGQLVDALAAANLGAQFNAPVVLATNSLSEDQIDALNLRAKSAKSLYQVGHGVDRDNVVKVIASKLGLLN